jgi:NodT family efflux transporter outer membrane factor (OMF) lipoprotein
MRARPHRGLVRLAAFASAAALLAGCAAVGPNYVPPAPPATSTYAQPGDLPNVGPVRTSVGDKVIADWWTLFHSPPMDQVVREAIANSPTLEAARARLAAAREAVTAQTGQLFVNGNASYQRERANLSAAGFTPKAIPGFSFPTNPEFNLFTIGTTVSYNLDVFGGVRRNKEALLADADEKQRELDAAYLTLTGNVVVQALIMADANLHIQILNEIVANDQADLDMVQKSRAAGGSTDADVATIAAQLAEDQSLLPAERQRLAAARHQLAILVGKRPDEWAPPDFTAYAFTMAQDLPVAIPSELVRNRPDILQAEAKLHAATARIGVATAALYPNITLTGSITQGALTPEKIFSPLSTSYAVGPGLTLPIFNSGQLHAAKRQAEADARAALADYQQTVLTAFAQVADQLQAIVHDNEAYAARAKALAEADAKLEIMRRGFRAGGVSGLQLVDAERTWRQNRLRMYEELQSRAGHAALLLLATANVPPGAAEHPTPAPVAQTAAATPATP